MAVWRRRALELFPEHRREITRPEHTVYQVFFDLKVMLKTAFDTNDTTLLRKIFGYAEWCALQTAQPLWNAAGVVFYEQLFVDAAYAESIVPWLSPRVVYLNWDLWSRDNSEGWLLVVDAMQAKRSLGERQTSQRRRT